MQKDNQGSLLVLDNLVGDKKLTLFNIYGPNRDCPEFYTDLANRISIYDNTVVKGGDFNLLLNKEMDTYNNANFHNPKVGRKTLRN